MLFSSSFTPSLSSFLDTFDILEELLETLRPLFLSFEELLNSNLDDFLLLVPVSFVEPLIVVLAKSIFFEFLSFFFYSIANTTMNIINIAATIPIMSQIHQ